MVPISLADCRIFKISALGPLFTKIRNSTVDFKFYFNVESENVYI